MGRRLKIPVPRTIETEIKTVEVMAKVRDSGTYSIKDPQGNELKEHDGYVPSFFPGNDSDYLDLIIDIDTGLILNWKKPSVEEMTEFFKVEE